MRFGNKEKVVFGSVAGLAVIAALHALVFKQRADELKTEQTEYLNQKNAISQLGQPKDIQTIYRFQLANAGYGIQFYNAIDDLQLTVPEHYSSKIDVNKQKEDFRQELALLLEKRKDDKKPKLGFLEENKWDLPDKLPDAVTAGGEDLGDKIRQVVDADDVIRVLPADSALRKQKEYEYNQLLRALGVDLDKAKYVLPQYGGAVPTFYILVREKLIRDALPKDFNLKTPLEDLLRLTWPKEMVHTVKQIQALNAMIKMAEEAGVEEINSVTFDQVLGIYPYSDTLAAIAAGQSQAAAGAAAQAGVSPASAYGNPYNPAAGGLAPGQGAPGEAASEAAMMGKGGYIEPAGPGAGSAPYGGAAGMGGSTVKPDEIAKILGGSAPIKLEFSGPNLNLMKFMYQITHSKRTYDIDYIAIQSVSEPSGWIRVIANINCVTIAGMKLHSPEQVKAELEKLTKSKKELESKPGVVVEKPSAAPTKPSVAKEEKKPPV